jgi:hypothetical protein
MHTDSKFEWADRTKGIISDHARGMKTLAIATKWNVSRAWVLQNVSENDYYSRSNKNKYALQRKIQFQLLEEYPQTFKEIMSADLQSPGSESNR